jgi:hypothetical protein
MAAPTILPIRLGLTGTGPAVEKLHWPALCRLADRYVVTADDVDAVLILSAPRATVQVRNRHGALRPRIARRRRDRSPAPDGVRQRPRYRSGVHHIAQIRPLCGLAGSSSERRVTRSSSASFAA